MFPPVYPAPVGKISVRHERFLLPSKTRTISSFLLLIEPHQRNLFLRNIYNTSYVCALALLMSKGLVMYVSELIPTLIKNQVDWLGRQPISAVPKQREYVQGFVCRLERHRQKWQKVAIAAFCRPPKLSASGKNGRNENIENRRQFFFLGSFGFGSKLVSFKAVRSWIQVIWDLNCSV